MSNAQLLAIMGTDATKWTNEFLVRFPEGTNDWGTLMGWFANAIEAGRSAGIKYKLYSWTPPNLDN